MKRIYLTILIYPLWSLILSFRYYRIPQAKNLFWLFCIFLGMIHIYSPEGSEDTTDGYRYAQGFSELHDNPVSLQLYFSSFYKEGGIIDIYQPVVTYFLSIFTGDARWLFFIFAIVFGFFYSRNCWLLLEKIPKKLDIPLILLLFYFILICPIWSINGVRMWTAFHVFVYGALPFLFNGDKSKLIFCFLSLFIHFSFVFPLGILIVYYFIPKSLNFFLILYLISFFMRELDIEQIREFLVSNAPSFLSDRAVGYTNEAYIQQVKEQKSEMNFYVDGSYIISQWLITALLVVVCIWGRKLIQNSPKLLDLTCFSLFIYAISNILSVIPAIGRFTILSQMFAFAAVTLFYIYYTQQTEQQKEVSLAYKYLPILLLFPVIVILRQGCDYYGISLFFNPIAALFIEDNQPFINLIKSIF